MARYSPLTEIAMDGNRHKQKELLLIKLVSLKLKKSENAWCQLPLSVVCRRACKLPNLAKSLVGSRLQQAKH